ncbi:MAG: hypothetical protein WCJ84_02205 [Candidatus Peregrinibacteria bacterium]
MSRFFSYFAVATLSLLAFSPLSFADSKSDSLEYFNTIDAAVTNTLIDGDFSASVSPKGSLHVTEKDDVDLSFGYDGKIVTVEKNGTLLRWKVSGQTVSFEGKNLLPAKKMTRGEDWRKIWFPIKGSFAISGEEFFDYKSLNFAEKMSNPVLTVEGNARAQNVLEGILEYGELFFEKWIAIDVPTLRKEFPESFEDFDAEVAKMKKELSGKPFREAIKAAIQSEMVTITKNEEVYTFSLPASVLGENNSGTLSVTLSGNTLKSINFSSVVKNPVDGISGDFSLNADIQKGSPAIVFPTIQKSDWEVTKIIKAFLEFYKDEIIRNNEDKAFFKNMQNGYVPLRALTTGEEALVVSASKNTEVQNALRFLVTTEYGDKVGKLLASLKTLDKKVDLKDYFSVARIFGRIPSYDKENWKSSWEYSRGSEYEMSYWKDFLINKITSERISYFPSENLQNDKIKTRGDLFIFLAKLIHAEKMNTVQ